MKAIFIQGHLGLGDAIILNGLVRHFAKVYPESTIYFPAKRHNVNSVAWMFSDEPRIRVVGVESDLDASNLRGVFERACLDVLRLGLFHPTEPLDEVRWAEQFYTQAGIDPELRWSGFFAPKSENQVPIPSGDYCFVHDDPERGFLIKHSFIPDMPRVRPGGSLNIFDYVPMIRNAAEVHVIDSAFACLIDSIPTKDKTPTLHLYARPGAQPPIYRKQWKILR